MPRSARPPRQAVTLVEQLVVVAIIGVLVGLLLPAIAKVREASYRIRCCSNLKQLALAVHSYHDRAGLFPVNSLPAPNGPYGSTTTSWSWLARVLPYLEQDNLYLQANIPNDTLYQSRQLVAAEVKLFLCPSDSSASQGPRADEANLGHVYPPNIPAGLTSYKGVSGANWNWGEPKWRNQGTNGSYDGLAYGDGVFYRYDWKTPKGIAGILDGTSNTFLIGEDLCDRTHWFAWAHANGSVATCAIAPNARRDDGTEYGDWEWENRYSFHSRHSGGVHFAFADGSVRFINDSIDLATYRALATIRGGERAEAP